MIKTRSFNLAKLFRAGLLTLCLFGMASSLSSCIVAPFIDSYNQLGLSKVDREKLIQKPVKSFFEKLYWGSPLQASELVVYEKRAGVLPKLTAIVKNVRVFEHAIDSVTFDEESRKATVVTNVKQFQIPFYVVETKPITTTWSFTTSSGWMIEDVSTPTTATVVQ